MKQLTKHKCPPDFLLNIREQKTGKSEPPDPSSETSVDKLLPSEISEWSAFRFIFTVSQSDAAAASSFLDHLHNLNSCMYIFRLKFHGLLLRCKYTLLSTSIPENKAFIVGAKVASERALCEEFPRFALVTHHSSSSISE